MSYQMKTKGRRAYVRNKKRLKWWRRNNTTFLIIAAVICAIVALILGIEAYNYERVKSMEAILDKNLKTIHRKTGLTDSDVEKLRKAHPEFNWEKTWDRDRWLEGEKQMKKDLSEARAKKDFQVEKKKKLLQLERKRKQNERAMKR